MVNVEVYKSYTQCLNQSKSDYQADPEILHALFELDHSVSTIQSTLNHKYPVAELTHSSIQSLILETEQTFLNGVFGDHRNSYLLSVVLKKARRMTPLNLISANGSTDDKSHIIFWGESGDHAPYAVSIYLHYPQECRRLIFVAVEMPQYLDAVIDEIKNDQFDWGSIAKEYHGWLKGL